MNRSLLTVCATLAICVSACGGGGGGSTGPSGSTSGSTSGNGNGSNGNSAVPSNTVIARAADTFDPAALTVTVGTTVSFTFESTFHNVTFNAVAGRPADIPGNNANTTITRQFNTIGTFGYQCTIHSGMTGTITVTQ